MPNKPYRRPPPPQPIYDALVRFGLKPEQEFTFESKSDVLMKVNGPGIAKLVRRHYWVKSRRLHISLLPDDDGTVNTALVSAADGVKRPGFWYIVLDVTGRPVAEHPLTYTRNIVEPHKPESTLGMDDPTPQPPHPPSGQGAVPPSDSMHWRVESHGDLARTMMSWFVAYDRVNDDASAKVLEILAKHLESPREIILELGSRSIALRLHDELVCYEDDLAGLPHHLDLARKLRERIALLFKTDPLEYP